MFCRKCKTEKPDDGFYKGKPTRCKDCLKADAKAYASTESGIASHNAARKRYEASHKNEVIQAKRKYARSERGEATKQQYRATERGKEVAAINTKRQRQKFPMRNKARQDLNNAVRDGRVKPWPVCALPTCGASPEAHHPDYNQPFDVVWLCRKHHKAAHALAREVA